MRKAIPVVLLACAAAAVLLNSASCGDDTCRIQIEAPGEGDPIEVTICGRCADDQSDGEDGHEDQRRDEAGDLLVDRGRGIAGRLGPLQHLLDELIVNLVLDEEPAAGQRHALGLARTITGADPKWLIVLRRLRRPRLLPSQGPLP